jgi:hypothetical protein
MRPAPPPAASAGPARLKPPSHEALRAKGRALAPLLAVMRALRPPALAPVREAYCQASRPPALLLLLPAFLLPSWLPHNFLSANTLL